MAKQKASRRRLRAGISGGFFLTDNICGHKAERKHRRRREGGRKNIYVGNKGLGAVTVFDHTGAGENGLSDKRSDQSREQYLGEDPDPLEHARLSPGRQIPDPGTEHGHARQVSAHHEKGTEENGNGGRKEIQNPVPGHEPRHADAHGEGKTPPVVDLAPQGGHHGGQHDGRRHDEYVIAHAKGYLVVEDQIRHEDLYGDIEYHKGGQTQVQGYVLPYRGGEKSVHYGVQILRLCRSDLRLPEKKQTQHAHGQHHRADDSEDHRPAFRPVQIKSHKPAEHRQNRHQRHHGVDALRTAPVRLVGGIGEPCVERRIVGAGAEEGHDAIQNDHKRNTHRRGGRGHGEQGPQDFLPKKNEAENGDAPQNIAAADEKLPAADLVGQSPDENGGHRGGHRAGGHHQGDIPGGRAEHLIDEYVQVHVLHDPRNLTHQAEDGQGDPEAGGELCFGLFHRCNSFSLWGL